RRRLSPLPCPHPPTPALYTLSLHDALPILAVLNSGRGSRPGLSNSAMMSVTVGIPKVSSAKSAGRRVFKTRVFPMSSETLSPVRSEEHTSELQSRFDLVCRLLLEKQKRTRV